MCEVIASVIVRKSSFIHVSNSERLQTHSCLNLVRTVLSPPLLTPSYFCLWGWMKSEDYKRKVDTRDELVARSLDPTARTNVREDLLNEKCDLHTRVAECTEVDGNVFKPLL